ncbi:interleukin-13 [Gracilinanus agilis]|uniref:interleukin-13 n=1 Tax=Gracilinanus agilis TaxID=191870 RepID=UPI001CFCFE63|nr:interleukin-13 [Gracilinanus agilis]
MGLALWMKGIILLVCLEGISSSSVVNVTMKEIMEQLGSLKNKTRPLTCKSSMVWQVNFNKAKMLYNSSMTRQANLKKICAALEVLNNITNCQEIEPLKRNMRFFLYNNNTRNETCLETQDTKIQLSRFLGDLHTFLLRLNRDWLTK